ncbi:MAG: MlaD family protein [Nocardioides sp.]|uniref:MCE family protein n=1 Tax=Nocardioides sp. TaxID=35761 RepID=UPI0039E3A248
MQVKMFRERNPVMLGLVVVAALLLLVVVVFRVNALVSIFGRHYHAEISEAAGLKPGDAVRLSGIKVGRVNAVKLGKPGGGVVVDFSVTNDDAHLGSATEASVSVETVLGDKALVLDSQGAGTLATGSTIPLARTHAPYDVNDALTDLTQETGAIDTVTLAKALTTLSGTLTAAAPDVAAAFDGVARLSATISSRDADLRSLLSEADQFTGVLAARSGDLTTLIADGNKLLAVLSARRDEIRSLLVNVTSMMKQIRGLISDNKDVLQPTLDRLNQVVDVLRDNKANLDAAMKGLAVYATGLGEVVSSGPFFTAYLQNLLPGNLVPPAIDLSGLDLTGLLGGTSKGAK